MTDLREPEHDTRDDDEGLSKETFENVTKAIDADDGQRLDTLLEPMHAADVADLIEQLTPVRRRAFLDLYSGEIDGDILSEIDESIRDEVVEQQAGVAFADAVARGGSGNQGHDAKQGDDRRSLILREYPAEDQADQAELDDAAQAGDDQAFFEAQRKEKRYAEADENQAGSDGNVAIGEVDGAKCVHCDASSGLS